MTTQTKAPSSADAAVKETFRVWVFKWEDGAVTATTDTPTAKTKRYLVQGTLVLDPPKKKATKR